jgi:hypothetical protein
MLRFKLITKKLLLSSCMTPWVANQPITRSLSAQDNSIQLNVYLHLCPERCSNPRLSAFELVVCATASYYGDPGFKSGAGHRLS